MKNQILIILIYTIKREDNSEYIFNNNNIQETNNNLKKWILFDSSFTTHLFSNRNLTRKIWNANNIQGMVSNGGTLDDNQMVNIKGIDDVPISKERRANILSMAKLID